MSYTLEILVTISSYFLGCVSTGYYLVRLRTGQDIRSIGSGSTGTRNVGRLLGIKGFIITALGDLIKGAVPVGITLYLEFESWSVILVMIAVVIGHIWPIQLHFKGGRGVVTTAGALLVLDYRLVLVSLVVAGCIYIITRRGTVSGLIAIALCPVIARVLGKTPVIILGISVLVLVLLIAHRLYVRELFKLLRTKSK